MVKLSLFSNIAEVKLMSKHLAPSKRSHVWVGIPHQTTGNAEVDLFVIQVTSETRCRHQSRHGRLRGPLSVSAFAFFSRECRFFQRHSRFGCAGKTKSDYADQHDASSSAATSLKGIIRHSLTFDIVPLLSPRLILPAKPPADRPEWLAAQAGNMRPK